MSYFYDNDVRKIPGPSYLFDYILTRDALPSHFNLYKGRTKDENIHDVTLTENEYKALRAVQIGRYILFDPHPEGDKSNAQYAQYMGTAWQKVVDNQNGTTKVTFALVADKYTNPIEGLDANEMQRIWNHVWGGDA